SHVCYAGNLKESRFDHPILKLTQLHGVKRLTHESVAVEFTNRRRERPQRRLHAIGQRGVSQFFEYDLACKVVVGVVSKSQLDHRQAEYRSRAPGNHVRHTVQGSLYRYADLSLHLFGGVTRE